MAVRLLDCDTDELDAMERHAKRTALGRGMWEPTFQTAVIEGHACFVKHNGEMFVLFESNARRYSLISKTLMDAMRTALFGVGYREDDLLNNGCGVQMVATAIVQDTSKQAVQVKAVNVTARKGTGHNCIALEHKDSDNAGLYRELDEELEHEAREMAGH